MENKPTQHGKQINVPTETNKNNTNHSDSDHSEYDQTSLNQEFQPNLIHKKEDPDLETTKPKNSPRTFSPKLIRIIHQTEFSFFKKWIIVISAAAIIALLISLWHLINFKAIFNISQRNSPIFLLVIVLGLLVFQLISRYFFPSKTTNQEDAETKTNAHEQFSSLCTITLILYLTIIPVRIVLYNSTIGIHFILLIIIVYNIVETIRIRYFLATVFSLFNSQIILFGYTLYYGYLSYFYLIFISSIGLYIALTYYQKNLIFLILGYLLVILANLFSFLLPEFWNYSFILIITFLSLAHFHFLLWFKVAALDSILIWLTSILIQGLYLFYVFQNLFIPYLCFLSLFSLTYLTVIYYFKFHRKFNHIIYILTYIFIIPLLCLTFYLNFYAQNIALSFLLISIGYFSYLTDNEYLKRWVMPLLLSQFLFFITNFYTTDSIFIKLIYFGFNLGILLIHYKITLWISKQIDKDYGFEIWRMTLPTFSNTVKILIFILMLTFLYQTLQTYPIYNQVNYFIYDCYAGLWLTYIYSLYGRDKVIIEIYSQALLSSKEKLENYKKRLESFEKVYDKQIIKERFNLIRVLVFGFLLSIVVLKIYFILNLEQATETGFILYLLHSAFSFSFIILDGYFIESLSDKKKTYFRYMLILLVGFIFIYLSIDSYLLYKYFELPYLGYMAVRTLAALIAGGSIFYRGFIYKISIDRILGSGLIFITLLILVTIDIWFLSFQTRIVFLIFSFILLISISLIYKKLGKNILKFIDIDMTIKPTVRK